MPQDWNVEKVEKFRSWKLKCWKCWHVQQMYNRNIESVERNTTCYKDDHINSIMSILRVPSFIFSTFWHFNIFNISKLQLQHFNFTYRMQVPTSTLIMFNNWNVEILTISMLKKLKCWNVGSWTCLTCRHVEQLNCWTVEKLIQMDN